QEDHVVGVGDEIQRRQFVDLPGINRRLGAEIKVFEGLAERQAGKLRIADLAFGGLLQPGIQDLGCILEPQGDQLLAGTLDDQHQRSPARSASYTRKERTSTSGPATCRATAGRGRLVPPSGTPASCPGRGTVSPGSKARGWRAMTRSPSRISTVTSSAWTLTYRPAYRQGTP